MRISDWSSDVCSSDLVAAGTHFQNPERRINMSILQCGVLDDRTIVRDSNNREALLGDKSPKRLQQIYRIDNMLQHVLQPDGIVFFPGFYLFLQEADRKSSRLNSSH